MTDYVSVEQVKELFDKLMPWDKVKFIKEIKVGKYLTTDELIREGDEEALKEIFGSNKIEDTTEW